MRRWGKWVSEIRDPIMKKRIWLGSFRTEAEAAHAFDAAALMCLRNPMSQLNFPHYSYIIPSGSAGCFSTREIQAAAAATAAASAGRSFSYNGFTQSSTSASSDSDDAQEIEDITYDEHQRYTHPSVPSYSCSSYARSWSNFDEDIDLVSEMARGMLMQPPAPDDDDDGDYNYPGPLYLWN